MSLGASLRRQRSLAHRTSTAYVWVTAAVARRLLYASRIWGLSPMSRYWMTRTSGYMEDGACSDPVDTRTSREATKPALFSVSHAPTRAQRTVRCAIVQ